MRSPSIEKQLIKKLWPLVSREIKTPKGFDYALITCIDVLGFRLRLITDTRAEIERLIDESSRTMRVCGLSLTNVVDQLESPFRRTRYFQDTFVGITELGCKTNLPQDLQDLLRELQCALFAQEIENICNIQMNFIRKSVLVRGSLAAGPVLVKRQSVIGEGWLRAHDLESNLAKYPRVIVAAELIGDLDQHPFLKDFLERALTRDEDNEVFVNYLWGSSLCYLRFQDYLDILKEHQDAIIELQKNSSERQVPDEKLKWLIEYHNKEVQRVSGLIRQRYTCCDPLEWAIPPVPHPASDKVGDW
jgi:hypothetical protein